MEKIIDGKRYDTDKAKWCGEWYNGESGVHRIVETLYQKKTGEYFLQGDGEADTKYSKHIGNNQFVGTIKLIPLSDAEAHAWAEAHLSAEMISKIFDVEDDGELKQITFRANSIRRDKLTKYAKMHNKTQQEILCEIIDSLEL